MTATNIARALSEIIPILDSVGIDYWLGRGVLRNLYITGQIGEENSDLDFHIWKRDGVLVKNKLQSLFASSYNDLKIDDKNYKLAFYTPVRNNRHDFFVEFMYLFRDENNINYVYHERNDGRRYSKASCFEPELRLFLEYDVQLLRIPALTGDYLLGTYGPEWHKNLKQSKNLKSTPELLREYEKQIDQLAYKLYGLSPEEIEIVEGET